MHKKIRHQAFCYGLKIGLPGELAEDFAQDAVVVRLKGRRVIVKFLMIDYLRKWYGDNRTLAGLLKRVARHSVGEKIILDTIVVEESQSDLPVFEYSTWVQRDTEDRIIEAIDAKRL